MMYHSSQMEWLLVAALVLLALLILLALALLYRPLQEIMRMQVELRGLTERIGSLERNQGAVGQNLNLLHSELSQARISMNTLQSQASARVTLDQQVADSVRRLETIIAGTHSKGAAGENILDVVFAQLPVEWQVRDFRVGNKTVEFALRLPNNRILPIDSKWPATHLVEQLARSTDPDECRRLRDQICAQVVAKAREVRKYVDPTITVNFGIVAVPDAVYDLSTDAQVTCFDLDVVLVAYSMFVPYLLLVFQTVLKTSSDIDLEKLDSHLRLAEQTALEIQQELEGRFSRAITMLANSKSDVSALLSKLGNSLTNIHTSADRSLEADPYGASRISEESW